MQSFHIWNSANHVKIGNLDFEVLGTEIKLTVQNENGEGKLQYVPLL